MAVTALFSLLLLPMLGSTSSSNVFMRDNVQTPSSPPTTSTNVTILWMYAKFGSDHARGIIPAGELATEHVNAHPTLLEPYVRLHVLPSWTHYDTNGGSVQEALGVIVKLIYGHSDSSQPSVVQLIVGPYSATEAKSVAQLAPNWNLMTLSYYATSPALANPLIYPLFARASGNDGDFSTAVLAMLQYFGYTHVVCIYLNEGFALDVQPVLEPFLASNNIKITKTSVYREAESRNYTTAAIQASATFVVIMVDGGDNGRRLLCEAFKQHGVSARNYMWFFIATTWPTWYRSVPSDTVQCSPSEQQRILTGSIMLSYRSWDAHAANSTSITGYTANRVQQLVLQRIARDYPNSAPLIAGVASYQYDTIVAAALALRNVEQILRAQNRSLSEFNYTTGGATAQLIKRELLALDFQGVTGRVQFRPSGDRVLHVPIWQFQRDAEFVEVGSYDETQAPPLQLLKPLVFDTSDDLPPMDIVVARFFDNVLNIVFVAVLASLAVIVPVLVLAIRICWL